MRQPRFLLLVFLLTLVSTPAFSQPLRPIATLRLSGSTAYGLAQANGSLWVTHFESSFVSEVDPRAGAEIRTVEIGRSAGSVTAVGNRLWIARYADRPQDSELVVMDPAAGRVVKRIDTPHLCCEVAGAAKKVWAVDPRGTLLRIDPNAGRIAGKAPVPIDPAVHIALVASDRALWLSSDTTPLLKVDPATGRVASQVDVGGGIPMALSRGLVWGAGPHHVWAVHAASGQVRVRLELPNTIETLSLAVTNDTLWVGARRPGYVGVVLRFDLATHELTGEVSVSLPARILYAFGDIWIADWDTNTLSRFEP